MITVFRYTKAKSEDGHLEFVFHRDGTIVGFTELWRSEEGGWLVCLDVLVDTDAPVEHRRLFLCAGGDDLSPLGQDAFAYHVGTHESKGYIAYLFDVSHLPEQLRHELKAGKWKLQRRAPEHEDLSYKAKRIAEKVKDGNKERYDRRQEIAARRKETEDRRAESDAKREDRLRRMREAGELLVQARAEADEERARIAHEELLARAGQGDSEAEAALTTLRAANGDEEAAKIIAQREEAALAHPPRLRVVGEGG